MREIKWKLNNLPKSEEKEKGIEFLKDEEIAKAKAFHESFPQYEKTPLVKLDNLAKLLGVSGIYVKDESYRFGLNAFKVLGGSYSMGRYLAQRLNTDISELGYDKLTSKEIKEKLGEITFFTATDGNHGRGVAWTANKLGQKSVVLMPKGSSEFRLNKIKGEGADASITDLNYDDAECPITVVVEADEADCYYKSAEAGDGKPRFVGGDMPTIMAGLACGEPNTIGFEVLKNYSSAFVSAPDWVSAKGMRILGNPLRGDEKVISGESGAVTTGALVSILESEDLKDLREALKLDENSKVLLISTEGDTDPDKYRDIVWNGECQSK
ncbi:pyridoxal-phosphate dependent enzyme [Clostridioides difficile]|uniref:pyridoxal-phosphate dependent enzyme n=1 Tax=Clostridioides difficile TaxID=1496 RepID=UPI00097FF19B|nr:pyridoxal-phosphate dependent enzyme [Clostridioides difficile]SJV79552.1 diaminopropionate ammonia-lyase [Clostridioides difficile]